MGLFVPDTVFSKVLRFGIAVRALVTIMGEVVYIHFAVT